MNQKIFLEKLEQEYLANVAISCNKNADYASASDAFANFRMIEFMSQGKITAEQGIVTRMTDKLIRTVNLLTQEAKVSDEKIGDTLRDLANYSMILKIYIDHKKQQS